MASKGPGVQAETYQGCDDSEAELECVNFSVFHGLDFGFIKYYYQQIFLVEKIVSAAFVKRRMARLIIQACAVMANRK